MQATPDVKARFVEAARLEKEEHARRYPNYRYQPAHKRADIVRRRVRKDVNEDHKCDAVAALLIKGKAGAGLEQEVKRELAKLQPGDRKDPSQIQLITKRGRRRRKDAPGELSKGALRAERAAARARQMRQQWMDTSMLLPAHQRAQLEEIARQQHQQHPTYMLDVPDIGEVQYQLWEDEHGLQFWAPVEEIQEAFQADDFQDFQLPYIDPELQPGYNQGYQGFDLEYQSDMRIPSGADDGIYAEQPTEPYYGQYYPSAAEQETGQYRYEPQLLQPYEPHPDHAQIHHEAAAHQVGLDRGYPTEVYDPALLELQQPSAEQSLPPLDNELPTRDLDFGTAGELFGELKTHANGEGGRPWEL